MTATFTKTDSSGTSTDTNVVLDANTKILLNDERASLSAFVDAVNKVLGTTSPQYSGRAAIATNATTASRVSVENVEDD